MNSHYSNLAEVVREESALEGAKAPSVFESDSPSRNSLIARRFLFLLEPKRLAHALSVAVRTVQKWRNGEPIPRFREMKIIREGVRFCRELHGLEDAGVEAIEEEHNRFSRLLMLANQRGEVANA